MNEAKFKILIENFSPTLLAETFQKSNDFFRIKQNLIVSSKNDQFVDMVQLGEFELEDNTKIVVISAKVLSPLSERSGRKNQYDVAKKILKDNGSRYNAGIFIYYDSKGDFRMSLVYAEYLGTKVDYSTFRRFTYFVSKEQKNVTFIQQVSPFNFLNLKQLKELFSVEKVTKEFFKKYRDLFIDTLEDFEKNEVFQNTVVKTDISTSPDFVKKMMGQIVFLYFVQKKGWLGVRPNENWGSGDQTFLRTLFTACEKSNKNYFNDYLEPLFYKALAEKRGDDDFFEELNCRVPFLNGGLFESVYDWKNTNIYISNKTICNLLDFFDQYNFTVDENTPSDQEISVDPEMLGKIFENLLEVKDRKDKGAFYTPREIVHYMCRESLIQHLVSENTAPEERIRKLFEIKDTDLSLIVGNEDNAKKMKDIKEISEKIDISLRNVRIVDPAVGSGAFPMGMLNEISSVRYYLNSNFLHKPNVSGKELSLYDIKKETLESCIYAVDIEPGAVEIAKLRFWLALVVEYESNDSKIAPPTLPNLDYKIMQGNSLLEEYEGVKLFDEKIIKTVDTDKERQIDEIKHKQSLIQKEYFDLHSKNELTSIRKVELDTEAKKLNEQLKKLSYIEKNDVEKLGLFDSSEHKESKLKADELKSLQKQFFETNKKDKKESIKKDIEKLEWELIEATLIEQDKISELSKIQEFKKSNTKPFFLWKLHFADVFEQKGGFDIVIGNPPYVGEKGNKEIFRPISKGNLKEFYQGKMDLFYFFFHIALDYLNEGGVMAYITTNYYITATGAVELRKDIHNRSSILKLLNFGELKIFESALGQHNMITMLIKGKNDIKANTLITHKKGYLGADIINSIINGTDPDTDYYEMSQDELYGGNNIKLTSGGLDNILNKIKENSLVLGDIYKVNQGIVTGADKVSQSHLNKYQWDSKKGDGIFVLNKKESENILEKDFLKSWYKNSNATKWLTQNESNENILYINDIKNESKIKSIINHLQKFKDNLEQRREVHKGTRNWYDLWRARSQEIFEGEKIVAPQRSKTNTFGYNNIPWYASADVYFITSPKEGYNLKFLLGVLNSNIIYLWLYNRGKRKGEMLELYQEPLSHIPIPKITPKNKKELEQIEKIVDQILFAKKENNDSDTKNLEKEIDQLVYGLYGLTPEEIGIIENSSQK